MKCEYCENEIEKNEKFYLIDDEFYCDDCIKKSTVTYYNLKDDFEESYNEDEVEEFENIKELKWKYQSEIELHENLKNKSKNDKDEVYKKNINEICDRNIARYKKLLKLIEQETENE